MEASPAEILEKAIKQFEISLMTLKSLRPYLANSSKMTQAASTGEDLEKKFKKLLYSNNWPLAVEEKLRCDPQSDEAKMSRAHGILDHIVGRRIGGLKFLDYGTGEGHLAYAASERGAELSLGLDYVRKGWGIFPERAGFRLTTNKYELDNAGPFDVIVAHDVFDHMYEDVARNALEFVVENLANDGTLYMRCHPWTSRTAGHVFHSLNKAYIQLLFPPDDLKRMGIDPTLWRVTDPTTTYRAWFESIGLTVVRERPVTSEVPGFFKTPIMVERMKRLYNVDPDALSYNFIDYTLSK